MNLWSILAAVVGVDLLAMEYNVSEGNAVNFCLFLRDDIDRTIFVNVSTLNTGLASSKISISAKFPQSLPEKWFEIRFVAFGSSFSLAMRNTLALYHGIIIILWLAILFSLRLQVWWIMLK